MDLVKLLFAIITTNFDAVFLDQQRNKVAAIPLAIALDTANFVKEEGQDTCVWIANTGEGIRSMALHVLRNWCLTVFKRPFMHAAFGVMDVTVKEFALI